MSTNKFVGATFLDRLHFAVNEKLQGNWADLARKSELTPSTIHQIKTGSDPKMSSLERIGKALDVSLDWLLSGSGEMDRNEQRLNPISDQRAQKIVELYEALNEDQQKEILAAVEEKKRMNELVEIVNQLQKKLG